MVIQYDFENLRANKVRALLYINGGNEAHTDVAAMSLRMNYGFDRRSEKDAVGNQ